MQNRYEASTLRRRWNTGNTEFRMPRGGIGLPIIRRSPMPGETKAMDTVNANNGAGQTATSCTTVASIFCINAVSTGSSAFNRIGRKIHMKSLYLQGYFSPTGVAAASVSQFARIMIVYDKQANGAAPAIADVLRDQINNTGADANVSVFSSGLNLNNRERFDVILDKRFTLPGLTAAFGSNGNGGTANFMNINEYRKLGMRDVQFRSDSVPSTIADIASGALIMITFGDLTAVNAPFNLIFSCRVKYQDA